MSGINFKRKSRKEVTTPDHLVLGDYGERLANQYLKDHGYRIVATNFATPIGYSLRGRQITGEIDIIAYDESQEPYTLVFVEVKTRSSSDIAAPEAAVGIRKQRQIIRASRVYRRIIDVSTEPHRFDVVSVVIEPEGQTEINLLRGYFSEQRFNRSRWRARDF